MQYRREIDGLRAVAVLPVILFHAGFEVFRGGFVGVDEFFVISGYLITTIILAELEQGRFSIANFYERRARRILPALFLVMLACLPFAWLWLLPSDMQGFLQSVVAVCVFASNFLFWRESGYFDAAAELKPLLHTWSLAVEEQYYVLFPLVLLLCWKLGKRWILVLLGLGFAASLGLAHWAVQATPGAAFYLLPTRGWELLIGAFAAFYLAWPQRPAVGRLFGEVGGWLGLAMILYAVFAFSKATPFPGLHALVPTLGTLLVILFACPRTLVGRLIGSPVLVGVGLISYSAYLWHQPVFAFARHRSLSEPGPVVFLLLSALTLGLAYLSWRYVEAPFRDKSRFDRRRVAGLALGFSAFFVAVGAIGLADQGFRQRFDSGLDRFLAAQQDRNPRQSACNFLAGDVPRPDDYCTLGQGKVVGMLLGDPHADAVAHGLSQALADRQLALKSITYAGCPPIEQVYRVDEKAQHQCLEVNRQSFAYALANPEIEYVVLVARWALYVEGRYFDNREGGLESRLPVSLDVVDAAGRRLRHPEAERRLAVEAMYKASITRLLAAGKKVVLVYPVPEVGHDVPTRLAKFHILGIPDEVTTSYDVFLERNRRVLAVFDALGQHDNLIRVRPDALLCETVAGGRCRTVLDGRVLYYDDDHLSNVGARLLADKIVAGMARP